jgi:hypothetical protein
VRDIVSRIPCSNGKLKLLSTPREVYASEVDQLIGDLRDPQRAIPLVVLAQADSGDHKTPDLASRLTDRLCGLAQVVLLKGWLAYDSFIKCVPEARIPRRGVRLFWPGFADQRKVHPWWTGWHIKEAQPPLHDRLFYMLARLSVLAEPHDKAAIVVREALRRHEREVQATRLAAVEARVQDAQGRGDQQQTLTELRRQVADAEAYAIELMKQNDYLEDQKKQLKRERDSYLDALTIIGYTDSAKRLSDVPSDESDFSYLWSPLGRFQRRCDRFHGGCPPGMSKVRLC